MRLSELQEKDIINIRDGTKIGTIVDMEIDSNGRLVSFLVEKNKFFSFSSKNEIEISFQQIEKIGEDVILVGYPTKKDRKLEK